MSWSEHVAGILYDWGDRSDITVYPIVDNEMQSDNPTSSVVHKCNLYVKDVWNSFG